MWPQLVFRRFGSQWVRLSQCYQKLPPKLSLVLQGYNSKKIRCGLVLPSNNGGLQGGSAFLSALLADVYSPDQTWFHVWRQRYLQYNSPSTVLVKYGNVFDKQSGKLGGADVTTFSVPSPFLQKHDVEFLEVQSTNLLDDDGCHFYINLQQNVTNTSALYDWPTVNLKLNPNIRELPLPIENQLDPQWALGATCNFINDKKTVDGYLDAMQRSNFASVKKQLESKLQDVDGIFRDLQASVLENIARRENLHDQHRKLVNDKREISMKIQRWSESAHAELQSSVLPKLQEFVKNQLSIWKVYGYSESKLQLKLINMITGPLHNLQMVNSLNRLKGELQIDDMDSKNLVDTGEINHRATSLHKDINKIVYQNFLLLQLPLILVATLGVVSGECSSFSMGALASFGIVLGFSRVLAIWQSLLDSYVKRIRETLSSNIENEKVGLINEYQTSFATKEKDFETKYEIFRSLASFTD
ncbi:hypothetical protein ZYGR_0P02350 [Zygosaccharomyces rouxii]|uniref:ZYRO0E05896p n=2 Tax=Zygosaccharomyces rouxii TaxID=4956 RepID=C5E4H0_ZYGRC|nr:uncharacterized protein ZYRO0E05896g [Zygosaccharomyces rouxii]KAH9198211.1 hypothetical protein LQ764DRAFT_236120 [Zygosaccharomyces rouxii]GAV49590.1 hypothetical protein ZYGR_0P02350 [Zygosaccharomyces rouxii]CAR30931.1 ZYRO0E05896p [Zygosaccharomyces rouxii]